MNCKKCGKEIDKKAVICVNCGCKITKPFYKKWWFWLILVVAVLIVGSLSGGNEPDSNDNSNSVPEVKEEIIYEVVDFQVMLDALDENAMKAESEYQNKNIEITCNIKTFDSDGKYISVEPVGASEWNFLTAMCYITNDAQKDFLIQKNVGDTITIKGKVKSIGEVLGYSIDIKEVY